MELHLKEIEVPGHPHRPLRLRAAEKPYYCGGCKEIIIVPKSCYHCDHKDDEDQKCEFYLHEECVPPPTGRPFYLGLIKCDLRFHQEDPPRGKTMVCDACGMDVKGWFYQGSSKGKSYHLHPCCAKLDFKMSNVNLGDVVFDLKEKSAIKCLKCKNQGHSKDFRSWVYVSRCGKYCFHVSCMKENADMWTEEVGNNLQLISYETGSSSSSTVVQRERGRQGLDFLELVIELFIGVTCTIFGIPTWLVSPFVAFTVCCMDKKDMVDRFFRVCPALSLNFFTIPRYPLCVLSLRFIKMPFLTNHTYESFQHGYDFFTSEGHV